MKRKTLVALALVGTMVLSLASCGSDNSSGTSSAGSGSQQDGSSASISISVGFENTTEDDMYAAVSKWAELLKEKSGGTMELVLYPNSQLGSKNDLIDSMQMGEHVITVADGAFLADYNAPDLGILYAPYLFTSWDQVWTLVESEWFAEQNDLLAENGLRMLSADWKLGTRNLFLVDPVEGPEDLKGRKIRVPSNQIQIEETNAIGATATPMAAADVYQALQTGTIDGCENVNSALLSMKWCEVAKYVYEEEHVYNMAIWVCGTEMFDSLTEEQQTWLVESADEAGLYNNDLQDASAETIRETLINEQGVTFIPCTEEDKATLIKSCESFYANGASFGWSDGLYERIQEIIQ